MSAILDPVGAGQVAALLESDWKPLMKTPVVYWVNCQSGLPSDMLPGFRKNIRGIPIRAAHERKNTRNPIQGVAG